MASPLSHLLHADANTVPVLAPGTALGVVPGAVPNSVALAPPSYALHPSHTNPATIPSGIPPPNASSLGPPQPLPHLAIPANSLPTAATSIAALLAPPGQSQTYAPNTSLYQCADCLRRYSRPEHLQRHIATHTLGKRFVCDVCGKAFGRADLLKRHRSNHDDRADGTKKRRINSSPGAGRVAHACQACARARVKCEEQKPCARCRNRRIECEYAYSESGSAAAMHLLHLSATAHSHPQSTPEASASVAASAGPSGQPGDYDASLQRFSQTQGRIQPQGLSPLAGPANMQMSFNAPPGQIPGEISMAMAAGSTQPHPDQAQLPTPETMMDQNNADGFQASYASAANMAAASMLVNPHLPFSDFLRDVIYPLSDPSSRLAEAQGLAVLDFCDDSNLELNDVDFGQLDHWNLDGLAASQQQQASEYRQESAATATATRAEEAADIASMRQRLVTVWTESPWRWTPNRQDNAYREQGNLPVASSEANNAARLQESRGRLLDRVVRDRLEAPGRDKILAIVLSTCQKDHSMVTRVASSFPSVEIMDSLIHIFLASHLCQVSVWIDYGAFSLNAQWPEWLACAASAGAVLTPSSTLRKFGYALQEAVRVSIPGRFEDNNTNIRDIGLVQALVLLFDIGLWSGNRRKMEIAECHLNIPLTMMRYRGKFQRSSYPAVSVTPADAGAELEEKWAKWRESESWKRLVFHCYLTDAQASITTLTPPRLSYAELTLPLPESRQLWSARSAQEWRMHYVETAASQTKRPPSLPDLLRDIGLLATNHHRLDVQFAISIYLHAFWSLIWEYRQLNAVFRASASAVAPSSSYATAASASDGFAGGAPGSNPNPNPNPNLLLAARQQELVRMLQNFQLVTSGWHELSAQESLVLNLLMMNLHVSLDDLQLFSGKEDEEQARRIYPTLQRWSGGAEARQALWHAGQILGLAKAFPPGHLKDFYAIAVHHAALALWTWGVVRKAMRCPPQAAAGGVGGSGLGPGPGSGSGVGVGVGGGSNPGRGLGPEPVFLDELTGPATCSAAVQRYIGVGQGPAVIRGPAAAAAAVRDGGANAAATEAVASLDDPRACMEIAQDILRANFADGGRDGLPPIVENLCHLIKQLGYAAWAAGLG